MLTDDDRTTDRPYGVWSDLRHATLPESIRLLTLLKAVVIVVLGYLAWTGFWWKRYVDLRGYRSDLSYSFLADGIKGPDGKLYNRSQVLDALVQQALRNLAQAPRPAPAAGLPNAVPPKASPK